MTAGLVGRMVDDGTLDPFGLRKAVTTLIRVSENWPGDLPAYSNLLAAAIGIYKIQGFELDQFKAEQSLSNIFRGRYEALFSEFRYDVINAAIPDNHAGVTNPTLVLERIKLVDELRANETFVQTASRPINIVAAAKKKDFEFGSFETIRLEKLDSDDAESLRKALIEAQEGKDFKVGLHSLVGPINSFFDNTMVMAEDHDVRYARLTLAEAVSNYLLKAGDFTKLEG